MSVLSEERANVDGVDSSTVVSINGSEGSEGRVVILDLELSLEGLESSLEIDLFLDDRSQSKLDVSGEVVVSSNSDSISVHCNVSEEVVLTGEHHLGELSEAESSVAIAVKELDEGVGLGLADMVDGVVSKEVAEFSGVNLSAVVSVDSLEGRVGSEVPDVAESGSSVLEVSLSVANCDEEVLESSF